MPPRKKAAPKPKAKPKKTGRFTAVNFTRKWLYGPNDLSKIIETADEYQSLIKKGWQDHPFKK